MGADSLRCDWWPECSTPPLWVVEGHYGTALTCAEHLAEAEADMATRCCGVTIFAIGLFCRPHVLELMRLERVVWAMEVAGGGEHGS
jgi:hypothetical protein